MLTLSVPHSIISFATKKEVVAIGELCNGSTTDSDSVCWGSNPYSPANTSEQFVPRLFYARILLFTAALGHFFFASKYSESF